MKADSRREDVKPHKGLRMRIATALMYNHGSFKMETKEYLFS